MIKLNFQEPTTPEWNDWKERAAAAVKRMLDDYAKDIEPKIDAALYKEMKAILFGASFGKCVYCETKIVDVSDQGKLTPLDQPGDVEHYRPKGKVTDEDDAVVMVTGPGSRSRPHPGYFWLTYDWHNLFLACKTCNSPNSDKETGKLYGKGTRFPLKRKSLRALTPEQIKDELPLFLHPFFQSPEEHLEFVPETGEVVGKTDEGNTCIEMLNLNRPGLAEERKDVYQNVVARIGKADGAALDNSMNRLLEHLGFLMEYSEGRKAYALAGQKALRDSASRLRPIYNLLRTYFP